MCWLAAPIAAFRPSCCSAGAWANCSSSATPATSSISPPWAASNTASPLGHERCGAVQAAVSVVQHDTTFPGSIGQMIEPIIPAVLRARREGEDDLLDRAVKYNVRRVVERLRTTEQMLLEPQQTGKLKIVGARYDLDTGHVDFFE